MGIYSWDLEGGFSTSLPAPTPRLTVRCEYPDTDMLPTEVSFALSPSWITAHLVSVDEIEMRSGLEFFREMD
jgi:hypothetical protein